ncbi:hypothetical protein [Rhodococcoides yunnanense]|uniref:hypothetical protein n=1 Tax=Rhodococcoides yunnanense TaxID=278209 RepID=UPI0011150070|nr:hypothetical protein [Rhodococcus yunnanensis]
MPSPVAVSTSTSAHRVVVDGGFTGVVKIAHVVKLPQYGVSRFESRTTAQQDRWLVDYICTGTEQQVELLRKRIYRLPGVVRIDRRPAP